MTIEQKLILKNPNSCDGCEHLKKLATIGGHVRCEVYKKNMLPLDDISMSIKKVGRVERPQVCIDSEKGMG
jgi:hypothetical protein